MDSEEIEKEIRSIFTQFFDKNDIPMPIYRYKGHNIPYLEFTVLALSKLNTVKIRPDDILMCTYPGTVPYGDYFKHSQEMYAFSKDNPNVLIITFEEMKKDPVNAVLLIAKFLEKTVPDKLAESIADMCSFDKMKAEKELVCSYLREASKMKPVGTVYHSGAVDTWKKWLTVEQNEKMEAKIQSEFSDREIKFNF
ncbi:estrogen sulfotransferase-like [Octopus vulgaris]|uniref:Estrogen sulfotransferase-like n=1 Tax=Octopus vulgaris TaxID=6645 RepID=A0AA36F034_OCTVU|nr:estrogen sulfotransferase-like [Octopus vulgaris]